MNLAFVMTCLWVAVPVQAREVTFKPAQMLRAIQDEASPKTPVFPKKSSLSYEEKLSFYGVGLGIAMAAVPLSLKAASALGTVSNELSTSLLMPLGAFVLLPAGAVAWGQDTYAASKKLKRRSWLWPFLLGAGVQVGGFVAGSALGVNVANLDELVAFSFVQAVLLPVFTTALFAPEVAAPNPAGNNPAVLNARPEETHLRSSARRPLLSFPITSVAF